MNTLYSPKQRKNIILAITGITFCFLLYALRGLFPAILAAVVMYTMLLPAHKWMTHHKRVRPSLSALLLMLGSFVVIVLPLISLSSVLAQKVNSIIAEPEAIMAVVARVKHFFGLSDLNDKEFVDQAIAFVQNYVVNKFSSAVNVVLNLLLTFTIMYFLLYFMLVENVLFEKKVIRYLPFTDAQIKQFGMELKYTTYANLLGQGFIALVQGALLALGFLIFSFPDPIFWGFIAMIVSFLPVVGTPLVFLPAGIIAYVNGDHFSGIGIILWGFVVVSNIDNILRLLIAKKFNDTHPIITILGVIIGFPIFGLLGLVFGPILISYFLILVNILDRSNGGNNLILQHLPDAHDSA